MKKTILFVGLLIGGLMCKTVTAQVRASLNINLGIQPIWGPVGYDHVDYYYMPDINVYYNIPRRQYIYRDHGRWIFAASLPYRYHDFNLYSGYKVVVNAPRPYLHDQIYRTKYAGYRGNHSQQAIRDSHDSRYFVNKDHPEHNKWKEDNKRHERNNGNKDDHGNKDHGNKQDH